jgi:dTMP kinase
VSDTLGLFVTFEGGEGSGKSTQALLLAERLRAIGRVVLLAREPGGTPLGEIARALSRKPAVARRFHRALTGVDWQRIDPLAELLLMEASRAQLVAAVVRPALARGEVVVLDRFADSSLAYQGYGRGMELEAVRTANALATGGLSPALTVLLDIDPAVGVERKRGESGRDAIGSESLAFHNRVRQGYLALAAAEPTRWLALDARLPAATLAEAVWQRLAMKSESFARQSPVSDPPFPPGRGSGGGTGG